MLAVSLIVGLIAAVSCSKLAESKGRSTTKWAILGVLFGLFALIVIACLPTLNQDEPYATAPKESSYLDSPTRVWN